MKLTANQKLAALSYRFYQGGVWNPAPGDYYTTSRADLELYQVVSVKDGIVGTRYTEGSDVISEWPADEFLTAGFGPKRVFVPAWIFSAVEAPDAEASPTFLLFKDAMAEAEKAMQRYPQPNYVISKVAEEVGEVVKAAIHCAEGREKPEAVVDEIRQAMAMLIRLYVEGDEVHGLQPLAPIRNLLPGGRETEFSDLFDV